VGGGADVGVLEGSFDAALVGSEKKRCSYLPLRSIIKRAPKRYREILGGKENYYRIPRGSKLNVLLRESVLADHRKEYKNYVEGPAGKEKKKNNEKGGVST